MSRGDWTPEAVSELMWDAFCVLLLATAFLNW